MAIHFLKIIRNEILTRLSDDNPHPTAELNCSSPFELLIAVILSAQASDVGDNKATSKLYSVVNTPAVIYALGLEGLKAYVKTIGLFNTKAKNVLETCRVLAETLGVIHMVVIVAVKGMTNLMLALFDL